MPRRAALRKALRARLADPTEDGLVRQEAGHCLHALGARVVRGGDGAWVAQRIEALSALGAAATASAKRG